MRSLFLIITLLTLVSFSACQERCSNDKEVLQTRFSELLETVTNEDLSYNEEDWVAYDRKFRMYVEECYEGLKEEFTSSEKTEFWIGAGKYYWHRYGIGMVKELREQKDDVSQEIAINLKELGENSDNDLLRVLSKMKFNVSDSDMGKLENFMKDFSENFDYKEDKLDDLVKDLIKTFEKSSDNIEINIGD